MRIRGFGLLRAFFNSLVECILYFPVLFIPAYYLFPDSLTWLWPAAAWGAYLIGYAGSAYLRLNRQFKAVMWAAVVSIALGGWILGIDILLAYAIPVLFTASYRGSRMEQIDWSSMFPGTYYLVGLILYGASSFVLAFMDSFRTGIPVLTWFGAGALALTLLIVNQQLVLDETLPGKDQPVLERRVLRYNRSFVVVLLLIIAAIAFLPQLRHWFEEMARGLTSWLSGLFSAGPETPPESQATPQPPPELQLPDSEQKRPSRFMKWLESALVYGVFIAIGIGLMLLLLRFGKHLPKLLGILSKWMNRMMSRQEAQTSLGYEDEVEDIEHERAGQRLRRALGSMRLSKKDRGEERHDPNQIIRQMYRRILLQSIREGYNWKAALTPRETENDLKDWQEHSRERMPETLVELYEKARYGNRSLTEEEVQRLQHSRKR
ncbi:MULTISPECIES: DUF4129 domain-containing protein [Paenibacillus]|jgi:hypothetical protein|uniref:Protein-glutamine gamma-glutamyltransferase-like C-terminal domain-containing protein n=1 Tax=Paenibacillus lactis TaxID=228574 RepID=A0ABS4FDU7_9BACL|nr:DUF4129 domain-containing protein [Paenibacillus lactis]MBP1894429.1 hypothetical protein [Paenibacillus lactis]MCM3496191.1 DUF4129 domain-containing protein [Paenibacillus lactis]GIO94181.1 hypothetical protein J31TS3_54080 [Paenibacillus lactis]HAF98716.1 hypothetical protein [Paenibacillus lactis]